MNIKINAYTHPCTNDTATPLIQIQLFSVLIFSLELTPPNNCSPPSDSLFLHGLADYCDLKI